MEKYKEEEIIRLIGEGTDYDKKEMLETKDPESWLKSVSAFANGVGGSLIFGVKDDGEIVGLKDAKKDADTITTYICIILILILSKKTRYSATNGFFP